MTRSITAQLIIILLAATAFVISSCSSKGSGGGGPVNPCAGITIIVDGTATQTSGAGISDGSIAANASGGSGFTFSINGGAFQASGNFTGLAAATYTVTAKDSRGCTGSKSITVNATDICAGSTFTVGGTPVSATPCLSPANGSITVTTSGGAGFTYNINGGAFQASPTFNNLSANTTYTVGAKDAAGCFKTASVTVGATAAGPLFAAVKSIINANCAIAGCHVPGGTGPIDFTQDCNIVANNDRIKVRSVDNFGTVNQMPPPPAAGLSLANRNAIVNWVNAGGQYSN